MVSTEYLGCVSRRDALRILGVCTASAALSLRSMAFAQSESTGLSAIGYRRISYDVHDLAISQNFYARLLGLKVAFEDDQRCVLEFGDPVNALYLRKLKTADSKARLINFAFSVADYDSSRVEAELARRGLSPRPDGKYAWAVRDPNGITLHICSEREEFDEAQGVNKPPGFSTPSLFQALAVSYTVIRTDEISKSRDFYISLLGMKKIYEDDSQCFLAFGPADDHLCLRKLEPSASKPYIETFAFSLASFNRAEAQSKLKQQGLQPKADSSYGWVVEDPDGHSFGIARAGLLDFIGRSCHGDVRLCMD